jgi:hypothetical protein
MSRPALRFIEDPSPRRSADSYFIQLADLVAYSAFRALYPTKHEPGATIVPPSMWSEIGAATLTAVTSLKGGLPRGIVQGP